MFSTRPRADGQFDARSAHVVTHPSEHIVLGRSHILLIGSRFHTETGAADLSQCSIWSCPTKPGCCMITRPPERTTKLGMPRTLNRAATCGYFSVSTLTTTALPAISAAVLAHSG